MPEHIPSRIDGDGLKVAVLKATWHGDITERLAAAALEVLASSGVRDQDVLLVDVPGAYELPQAAAWLARGGDVDAIVAIGCVIRGETPHFEYVAGGCAEGLLRVGLETGVPVTMGVITADTREQAEARSGQATGKGGNKGVEAAEAALALAAAYKALEERRRQG